MSFFEFSVDNSELKWFIFFESLVFFAFSQWIFFPFIGRKFVYTRIASLSTTYCQKFETRVLSTICALVVGIPALIVLVTTKELLPGFDFFFPTFGTQAVSCIYAGYLVSDLVTLFFTRKTNTDFFPMLLHHVLSIVSCGTTAYAKVYSLGPLFMYMTELTTPFVNYIYIFPLMGMEDMSMANSSVLIVLWVIFRIVIAGFLMLYLEITQFNRYFELGRPIWEIALSILVPFVFGGLNFFWFYKLVKGYLKVMKNSREEKLKEKSKNYRRKLY